MVIPAKGQWSLPTVQEIAIRQKSIPSMTTTAISLRRIAHTTKHTLLSKRVLTSAATRDCSRDASCGELIMYSNIHAPGSVARFEITSQATALAYMSSCTQVLREKYHMVFFFLQQEDVLQYTVSATHGSQAASMLVLCSQLNSYHNNLRSTGDERTRSHVNPLCSQHHHHHHQLSFQAYKDDIESG